MPRAAVLGATGYLGGELLRVLSQHPTLDVVHVTSSRQAGQRLEAVAPNLARFGDLVLEASPDRIDADVAFVALPATESMSVVPPLLERGIKVVDLGPDYRLKDPAEFARVYGKPHEDPEHLDEAVYGLPELNRTAVRSARLVANPGCYSTAMLLAVAPLVRAGVVEGPVVVDAKSGTSGAGASPTSSSHHPEAAGTVWPYGTPEHRHLPEMRQMLASEESPAPPIVFVPHLVPLVRGILCSIYVRSAGPFDPARFTSVYARSYDGSPFVRVGGIPKLPWVAGTNRCFLSVNAVGTAPVLFSALDNLGKGGASQAIQNANLLLGRPETEGLLHSGFGV